MKKLITILIMCFCCSVFGAKAQSDTLAVETAKGTLAKVVEPPTVKLDSLTMEYIDAIYYQIITSTPRYKMYPTQNINILLKLDTATGRVWMVQYGTGDNMGLSVPVDDSSLLYSWDTVQAGRFELYPTQNMYNFILLDTQLGNTYQVQWHTKEESRMRVRIY